MQLLKKISIKEVCGDVSAIMRDAMKNNAEFPKEICQIFGIAASTFEGVGGPRNSYEGLNGNFEAINLITGEDFQGYKCFLPDQGLGFVRSLLLGSEGKPVEFGVSIAIQEPSRSGSQMMYEYVVKPIGKAERSERLKNLRQRLTNETKND